MCLLLGLLHKVFDSFALHDLVDTKDFIEIFFQLLTSSFDIFWTLVGDSKYFLFGELRSKGLINMLQVLYFAFHKGIMDVSKFAVPGFESPFFMRIQIPHSDVVNDNVIDKSVPIDTNLHIELTGGR